MPVSPVEPGSMFLPQINGIGKKFCGQGRKIEIADLREIPTI
jgi:hypothetical protein